MIEVDKDFVNAKEYIKNLLKISLCEKRKERIEACPHCKSNYFVKHGFYKEIQRYRCKNCGRTFSLTTDFIWKYSKKEPEKWAAFVELTLEKKTLRYCKAALGINLATAFYWRHKILQSLTTYIPEELHGNVYIAKSMMRENFKGCRNITTLERKPIWVVGARGSADSILAVPVCKSLWSMKSFNDKVYSKINKESYIVAYGDRYLSIVARKHNFGKVRKRQGDEVSIKGFSRNMFMWFRKFRGIATKYLNSYLCWFVIYFLDKKFKDINLLNSLSLNSIYIRIKDIKQVLVQ